MSESTPHNRAQEILQLFYTCWRGIASNLYINRSNIGQFVLLSLRFGQLLAAVVIGTVYCSLIHQHRHHICRLYPQTYQCQTRGREPKTNEVPWVYILALFTSIISFLQLFLTVITIFFSNDLNPKTSPSDRTQTTQTYVKLNVHLRRHILLWYTDFPVLLLYICSFIWLSDYLIPSQILLGSRTGTSCYYMNQYSAYLPVILQSCILGQHGYWFTMGAMISYFITTFLFMIYWIEDNTLRRVARAIETGRLSSRSQREEGRAEEVLIMLD